MKLFIAITLGLFTTQAFADGPKYKPSSRAPEAIDIASNAYGGSALAPEALSLKEAAPDFDLPVSGGGQYQLGARGPVTVIVFYRGHW